MKRIFTLVLAVVAAAAFGKDKIVDVGGSKVILHDNFTWEYAPQTAPDTSDLVLPPDPAASAVRRSKDGKYSVTYDPKVWSETKAIAQDAEFSLVNDTKTAWGTPIYDGLEVSLESMEQIVLANAKNIDPAAHILSVQACRIGSLNGEIVTYQASYHGLNFVYFNFIASGEGGTIQYVFATTTGLFDSLKPSFLKAISRLEFAPDGN